jgi:hypothetical protein
MSITRSAFAGALAIGLVAVAASPAAGQRSYGFSHGAHGPNGRGYTHSLNGSYGGGAGSSTHSVQTDRGYGATANRSHSVSDGTFNGSTSKSLNNGTNWGRSTTATANGDGTASYQRTYTGPGGETATRSGTVGWQH